MSQLNVDTLKNSSGTGNGIALQASGNIAFDTNTLYVDSTNDKVGINDSAPNASLEITGTEGVNINTSPIVEKVNTVSGTSNSNTTIDLLTASVWYFTSANTGNFTPNFRGNGNNTSVNIDGSGRTIEWIDGEAPDERGGTSGYDIYQYTILKTASNTFTVFACRSYCN